MSEEGSLTLGQKVRLLRREKGLTQAALCGDRLTRNMLSQIESDRATPSLSTVCYLAERLNIPAGYFLDRSSDLLSYRKIGRMESVRKLYHEKNYESCLAACKDFVDFDDELTLIMADCYLRIGLSDYRQGMIENARHSLRLAEVFATRTIYPHEDITRQAAVCLALIECPPDKLDQLNFPTLFGSSFFEDYELAVYVDLLRVIGSCKYEVASQIYDQSTLKNPLYRTHISARLSILAGNCDRAFNLLRELTRRFDDESASLVFRYLIYSDLEEVSKKMGDYRSAYESGESKRSCGERLSRSAGIRKDPHL